MKKGSIIALATGLALTVGTTALAANVNDVQNLETQLRDKLQSVQQQSLSDAQKTALQNAFVGVKQEKAMTAEQQAQWEQKRKQDIENMTAEQQAQMEAKRAERQAQEDAFTAMLTQEQKAAYEAMRPQQTQDRTQPVKPTEAERQAYKAMRDTFVATLNDTQKAAFDGLHAHGGRPLDKMTQVELDEHAVKLQAALDVLNQIVP